MMATFLTGQSDLKEMFGQVQRKMDATAETRVKEYLVRVFFFFWESDSCLSYGIYVYVYVLYIWVYAYILWFVWCMVRVFIGNVVWYMCMYVYVYV